MVAVLGVCTLGGMGYAVMRTPAMATESPQSAGSQYLEAQSKQIKEAAAGEVPPQDEIGDGTKFDRQGRIVGTDLEGHDLPRNRSLTAAGSNQREGGGEAGYAEIAANIEQPLPGPQVAGAPVEKPSREDLTRSMLAFSLSNSATWAERRPASAGSGAGQAVAADRPNSSAGEERMIAAVEKMVASEGAAASAEGSEGRQPQGLGESLYPAERSPQAFEHGFVGDMRIGPGPAEIVRQGKFLDTVVVNELRVDLVESPVTVMVNRDFLSLDGSAVLIPAGAKLLGSAGQVGNVQQVRVYIKLDRLLYPDQRSAYFPRKQIATDAMGAVGVEGDVDQHLFLQFGGAVMLGMLDGLAAAVQAPSAIAAPGRRDVMIGATSSNFSKVLASVIGRYANVVPTITVEPGSKMKVFFSEDVRLTPYRATRR